jgi:recombination protein RecR
VPTHPEPIASLIAALSTLPGIGPRSAERLALHLVQAEAGTVRQLAATLLKAREEIRFCGICGGLTREVPCAICADPRREATLVCVVERPVDILSIEKAKTFRGRFHVLGGRLSPLDGVGPEDLRIAELERRVTAEHIAEVLLALSTDVEGDATSHFLAKRLAPLGVRVTRIAHGLPAGTALDYADELTLSQAIEGRREIHQP